MKAPTKYASPKEAVKISPHAFTFAARLSSVTKKPILTQNGPAIGFSDKLTDRHEKERQLIYIPRSAAQCRTVARELELSFLHFVKGYHDEPHTFSALPRVRWVMAVTAPFLNRGRLLEAQPNYRNP
jgi:hypothetical protein